MGLTGVQRAISSAGLPGADDVSVDCKIFFVVIFGLQSILSLMLLLLVKILSAGLLGVNGVVVDCKIFFRCCFWTSKCSFFDVVVVG